MDWKKYSRKVIPTSLPPKRKRPTFVSNQYTKDMDVITIESQAYRELLKKIERIAEYISKVEAPVSSEKKEIWLDSMEVARLLGISTKTLQRLRKDQLISYSMFRGRCLYRLSDIERALNERLISCNPQTLEQFRKNYLLHDK